MTEYKPFWKRKRWIAAAVSWLVVAYPLSIGPLLYLNARGKLREPFRSVAVIVYEPTGMLRRTPLGPMWFQYQSWWRNVVFEDAGEPYIAITR